MLMDIVKTYYGFAYANNIFYFIDPSGFKTPMHSWWQWYGSKCYWI